MPDVIEMLEAPSYEERYCQRRLQAMGTWCARYPELRAERDMLRTADANFDVARLGLNDNPGHLAVIEEQQADIHRRLAEIDAVLKPAWIQFWAMWEAENPMPPELDLDDMEDL